MALRKTDDQEAFDPYKQSDELEQAAQDAGTAPPLPTNIDVKEPSPALMAALSARVRSKNAGPAPLAPGQAPTMTLAGLDILGRTPDAKAREEGAENPPNQTPPEKEVTPADTTQLPGASNPYPDLQDPRPLVAEAREKGDRGRLIAHLAQGVDTMNAALSRRAPNPAFAKSLEEEAAVPEKRAHEDMALEQFVRSQRTAMMENDPHSPQNRALQKAMASMFPSAAPGMFDNLTAKHLEKLDPVLQNIVRTKGEMELRKSIAEMTEAARVRAEQGKNDRAGANLDFREQHAGDKAAADAAKQAKKDEQAKADEEVPGFHRLNPDAPMPSWQKKSLSKFTDSEEGFHNVMDSLDRIEGIYKKSGRALVLPTEDQQRLISEMKNLGPELYKMEGLNRFNKEELQQLMEMLPDATAAKQAINPRVLAGLNQVRTIAKARANTTRKFMGYEEDAPEPNQGPSGGAPAGKKGYSKSENKTYTMAPDGKTVLKVEDGDTRSR